MKAKNIAFAIPALLCLAGTACTNLESEVYSAYNSSIFPQTAEDVEALLVGGVYAPFRSNQYEGLFAVNNRGVQTYNDMCTDLADCRWTDTYWFNLINVNFNTFEIEGPTLIYRDNIDNIARMLNIINTIEDMDDDKIDPDRKNELLAEAHCGPRRNRPPRSSKRTCWRPPSTCRPPSTTTMPITGASRAARPTPS